MCTGFGNHCSVGGEKQEVDLWRDLNSEHSTSGQEYIKPKGEKMVDGFSNPEV